MAGPVLDVAIVGAGISGIGAACWLRMRRPQATFAILEGRSEIGGTWDLFRYPGIRSDSDMHTLGFSFRPWTDAEAIADAPAIMRYLKAVIAEHDLAPHIRFDHRVREIAWDSAAACWTVSFADPGLAPVRARFLVMGTGYYAYDAPYRPTFPGEADFAGPIIHPQAWPEDLAVAGKRIVVIGSGATAVTLVPALVEGGAGHVTMLQRSPTWYFIRPRQDWLANLLRKVLPETLAYKLVRARNIFMQGHFFNKAMREPKKVGDWLLEQVKAHLPKGTDLSKDFTPRYGPWEQRLCLVPDGDLFAAVSAGKAGVVTDTIARFDAKGIVLSSGARLDADVIVTATGLHMEILRGVTLRVDGVAKPVNELLMYKGCMYGGVPNLVSVMGYTNASWTLRSELVAQYAIQLMETLEAKGAASATPRADGVVRSPDVVFTLSSGYLERARDRLPGMGTTDPWIFHHDYALDRTYIPDAAADERWLDFKPVQVPVQAPHAAAAAAAL